MAPMSRYERLKRAAQRLSFRIQARLTDSYGWVRFGTIVETIKSAEGSVVYEVEYRGRGNKVIGYWAHGYFDPKLPYQG